MLSAGAGLSGPGECCLLCVIFHFSVVFSFLVGFYDSYTSSSFSLLSSCFPDVSSPDSREAVIDCWLLLHRPVGQACTLLTRGLVILLMLRSKYLEWESSLSEALCCNCTSVGTLIHICLTSRPMKIGTVYGVSVALSSPWT